MNPTKTARLIRADIRPVLKAFGLASSATIFAVFFSVLTNKLISLFAGTEGVAVMGVYRNLGSLIAGTVTLGYSTVISEQIANSRSKDKESEILAAAFFLYLLQCLSGLIAIVFFAGMISDWVFGKGTSASELGEVRVVILMSFVNLAMQTLVAILRGRGYVRQISVVQVATAVFSCLVIYPLLQLGHFGLAINLASGGILGTVLGVFYVQKLFSPQWNKETIRKGVAFLKTTSLPSVLLTLESLVMAMGLLQVQSLINRYYGIDALGNYNAALLILDTSILVLMSSVKSYLLPKLGACEDTKAQTEVFGVKLSLLLVTGTLGGLILILFSKLIIALLFTKKFEVAVQLLAIFSISLVGQVINYCCNTLFTQKRNYWAVFGVDTLFIAAFCFSAFFAGTRGLSVTTIIWGYVWACTAVAVLNLALAVYRYGKAYFSFFNLTLSVFCLAILILAQQYVF